MEELRTENLKEAVRIRIEYPEPEKSRLLREGDMESLPFFYLFLLIISYPVSALGVYLAFWA